MAERIDLPQQPKERTEYKLDLLLKRLVDKGWRFYELWIMDEDMPKPRGTRSFVLPELGVKVAFKLSREAPDDTSELPDGGTEPRTVA